MDEDEILDLLAAEIDALHDLEKSEGYRLLVSECHQQYIDASEELLERVSPSDTARVAKLQERARVLSVVACQSAGGSAVARMIVTRKENRDEILARSARAKGEEDAPKGSPSVPYGATRGERIDL